MMNREKRNGFRRLMAHGALLMALLMSCIPSRADFNSDARGTTTADFLKLGVGARADAMGGAYSAVANDATALYWNPGALTNIPTKEGTATVMHAPYVASSYFDYAAFAKNINGYDAWGLGIQYFSAGSITQTDVNGFSQGSFSPSDMAVSAGYAHRFKFLSVGMDAKFIRSQIVTSAQTAAIDFGAVSNPLDQNKLRFSGVVTNVGGKMKFDQEADRLPMAYRLGASYQATRLWLTSADIAFPIDDNPYVALGSEYLWPLTRTWNFAARMGLNAQTISDLNILSGVSFGIGMDFNSVTVDYALEPLGDLGLTHRISVTFRFQPLSVVLPKHETNLHAPEYPDYHDAQPYFDDSPSLHDRMQ